MIAPMSTGQGFWKRVLFTTVAVVLTGQTAFAAETADNRWFDPQATPGTEAPSVPPAAPAAPAAAPDASTERPSLAPSPLLQERGAPAGTVTAAADDPGDRDPRALTAFRPTLDPYGSWVQHPTYGTVWVPNPNVVGREFTPYVSAGHWALDEDSNWIWVSDYPFGGVVFHYGRWVWIGGAGWAWVPGYRYAPAWVSWRVPTGSYAYVGWAPLGPSFIWYNGYASAYWYGVPTPWFYCSSHYVFHHRLHHYMVQDRTLVTRLNANTRVYVPARGVGVRQVSTFGGPSLAAARVPSQVAPAQRVRATPFRSSSPGAASPFARSPGGRVATAPRIATSSPGLGTRPERFRPPPSLPAPTSRSRVDGRFRSSPDSPRSFSPPASPPRPSAGAPRFSPGAPRLAPSPVVPRTRPSPRAPSPSPRFSPGTPRSFSPSPRSVSPSPRSFSPSPRSISPSPRSFSPGGGGFGPRGGGGGGFSPRGGGGGGPRGGRR